MNKVSPFLIFASEEGINTEIMSNNYIRRVVRSKANLSHRDVQIR